MEWLTQNWVWVVMFVLFIGLHLFGHAGHGGHGGRGSSGCCGGGDDQHPPGEEQPGKDKPQSHQH